MPFRDRLKIFAVGFLAGCALVMVILKNRGDRGERADGVPETPEARRAEAVAGLRKAYDERGLRLESRFVVEESSTPSGERGIRLRAFILKGEFSGQLLRVEESIADYATHRESVRDWRIMAADEVVVRLRPGAATPELAERLRPTGMRLVRRGAAPGTVVVRLPGGGLDAVPRALDLLRGHTDLVAAAGPKYLDKSNG